MIITSLLLAGVLGAGAQATTQNAREAVRIEAKDDGLSLSPRITAGLTTFSVENTGTEPHEVRFVRLNDKHTLADFSAWLKTGGAVPSWAVTAGGVGALAPGAKEEYLFNIAPGSYIVLCGHRGDDSVTHAEKGGFTPLQVDAGTSTLRPPDADRTVTLHDHGFQLTAPVEGGRSTWHLRNTGSEPHQALIVKLSESGDEYPERAWFNHGARGPRPGQPVGGVLEVPPGEEAWFRVELEPGHYLLLCAEREEDGQHFDLGMIYRFTIE
ncbi:MAG: hypothetical protein HY047_10170 [Acidobacteria bacterium]|nr:hypothetical protein [Acidobacteriota bacterium]